MKSVDNLTMLLEYMFIASLLSTVLNVASAQPCPATLPCTCDQGTGKGRIIDCRNKGLPTIPTFTPTDEVFWELTLKNDQSPNDPNYQPGKCPNCNTITSLPASAFAGLKVRRIDLSNNALTSVADNAFSGMEPYLNELLIESNKVTAPPYTALSRLSELTLLDMDHFFHQDIEVNNEFKNFTNLVTLELKNMGIRSIASMAFDGKLPNLKTLKLIGNKFASFPAGAIQKLVTLEHLTLTGNTVITTIPTDAFARLRHLIELDLSVNSINHLQTGCFNGLEDTLELLLLHRNLLIDEAKLAPVFDVTWAKLEQLNLGHNSLQTLSGGKFQKMPTLAYLSLDYNDLSSIAADMFTGLGAMHHIDLNTNKITDIAEGAFQHMPQMKLLDIEFQRYSDGSRLNLTRNSLKGLESTLNELKLRETSLVEGEIWEAIKPLTELSVLNLAKTGLTSISDFGFAYNHKLAHLDLSMNSISVIRQATFHGLRDTLTSLTLSENQIQTIDRCVFGNFTKLAQFALRDNPIRCDCDMTWLHDWITSHSDPFFGLYVQCSCAAPPSLNNMAIEDVPRASLTCGADHVAPVCHDYYATTTTTTIPASTTTPTLPPTTTPLPMPTLMVSIGTETVNTITVQWTVSDATYVTGFKLKYEKLGINPVPKEERIHKLDRQKSLEHLESDSRYSICINVEIRDSFTGTPRKCVVGITERKENTTVPGGTDTGGLSAEQIGTIVGVVIGSVVFVILVAAILYILLKKRGQSEKHSEAVVPRSFATAAAPKPGYDSKRFSKPKKDRLSTDPQDIQIKVISNGEVDKTDQSRISAGSYQNLNTDTHIQHDPMPSTSKYPDHYVNSNEGRPLPRAPYIDMGRPLQGYHPGIPSNNPYHEIGIETGI